MDQRAVEEAHDSLDRYRLQRRLLNAIFSKSSEEAIEALRLGADPNDSFDGSPFITLAVKKESVPMVRVLLEAGASAGASEGKNSALMLACASPGEIAGEMAGLLCRAGADPDEPRGRFYTPMQYAILNERSEAIKEMILAGYDARAPGPMAVSALDFAAAQGNNSVVSLMIEAEALRERRVLEKSVEEARPEASRPASRV